MLHVSVLVLSSSVLPMLKFTIKTDVKTLCEEAHYIYVVSTKR